jgi:hypothetical protein
MDPTPHQQQMMLEEAIRRAVAEAIATSHQQIEDLAAERRADRDTIRSLERRLNELTYTPQGLTPEAVTPATTPIPLVTKRKALPWPEKFDGNRSKFSGWRQQIADKLEIDADLIGHHKAQWYSINECLGEKCYNPHRYDPNYETSITAKIEPHG